MKLSNKCILSFLLILTFLLGPNDFCQIEAANNNISLSTHSNGSPTYQQPSIGLNIYQYPPLPENMDPFYFGLLEPYLGVVPLLEFADDSNIPLDDDSNVSQLSLICYEPELPLCGYLECRKEDGLLVEDLIPPEEHFSTVDKDENGKVTFEEFHDFVKETFEDYVEGEIPDWIFEQAMNHLDEMNPIFIPPFIGSIIGQEIANLAQAFNDAIRILKELNRLMNNLDPEGDGLTLPEIDQFLRDLLDPNGDGMVTENELNQLIRCNPDHPEFKNLLKNIKKLIDHIEQGTGEEIY